MKVQDRLEQLSKLGIELCANKKSEGHLGTGTVIRYEDGIEVILVRESINSLTYNSQLYLKHKEILETELGRTLNSNDPYDIDRETHYLYDKSLDIIYQFEMPDRKYLKDK